MGKRPFGVTLVGLLVVLGGIAAILTGVLGLFSGDSVGVGLVVMIVMIVIGLIYLVVAKGIFTGSNGARMLVALFTLIGIVQGAFAIFYNSVTVGLSEIIWGLIILTLLYSGRAKVFFGSKASA